MLKNDLVLRAAKGQKTERIPVWLMRAAAFFLRAGIVPPVAGGVARSFFFGVTDVQLRV